MWKLGLEKAGLAERDEDTRYLKRRIHSLRTFFRSQLVAAGVVLDVVEALMGHEGYLTRAYRNYAREQIAEFYSKGEYAVTIYGSANLKDLSEKNEKLNESFENSSKALGLVVDQQARIEELEKDKALKEVEIENLKSDFDRLKDFTLGLNSYIEMVSEIQEWKEMKQVSFEQQEESYREALDAGQVKVWTREDRQQMRKKLEDARNSLHPN